MASVDAGLDALAAGQLVAARSELHAALAEEGTSARGWKGLAQACRRLEDWQGALVALEGVLTTTGGTDEAVTSLLLRATLLDRQLDQPEASMRVLNQVLQLDDTHAHAWLALAELNLRCQRWRQAMAHADHGLQRGTLDSTQRSFLLLIRALGQHLDAQSDEPVSRFFHALGGTTGDQTLAQALNTWPDLGPLLPQAPLDSAAQTAQALRTHLPRASPPSWWGH